MGNKRIILIWILLAAAIALPIAAAALSPLLAWRSAIYILAGFAGIVAMTLLLVQPLLIGGYMPGLTPRQQRSMHRWTGSILAAMVAIHITGLWITSPPDVVDALTFTSPTPFSNWGVIAMWAVLATIMLAILRKRLRMKPKTWRIVHGLLALIIVVGTIVHALLIEGTMETATKFGLSALILIATIKLIIDLRTRSSIKL